MAEPKLKGLVIVESPAKAKKISGFLGKDYVVMASMGHVRDLPAKAAEVPPEYKKQPWGTLGVNVDEGFDPIYVVPTEKKKVVKELKSALKDAQVLILATDEDREGESIGWHLAKLLSPKVPIKRMVFSEITKGAILKAIETPRELDFNLVTAQETRRVLDRLFGYTLSPLLWKKVARGLSAGRVQSVSVRVLVARELERLAFKSAQYWDLKAQLAKGGATPFAAQLMTVGGKRVATGKDFDENTGKLKPGADVLLLDESQAKALRERIEKTDWKVAKVEDRTQSRKPSPPFTTSTLQQEANRKLNMSARHTMQVAQRLYEQGHITYMRTDSVSLSNEAIEAARGCVDSRYGQEYLSPGPRQFTGKSKNAQEAHEAIRPAGTEMKTGDEIGLSGDEIKLYDLIWKRTVATQMAEARLKFQTVTIQAEDTEFRATGRHVEFAGFFRAYVEGSDDPEAALDDKDDVLPPMTEADVLKLNELAALDHETKPPARYTEASLVRKLEEEGIGRPSTYASIIGTIQDRGYVRKVNNQLVPTFTALAVTRLLEEYFPRLVDLNFTAKMEQTLDDIADGSAEHLPYLQAFYHGPEGLAEQVKAKEETIDARTACTLKLQGIDADIRVGRYGPYVEQRESDEEVVTASIPADTAPAELSNDEIKKLIKAKKDGPQSLGMHPEEGLPIFVLRGPFGPYLQLGEMGEDGKKPKRTGIPKNYDPDAIELDTAIQLLALPKRLGHHPETKKVVNAGIGRFGPYVLHEGKYKSLGKDHDVLTVDLDTAIELLKQAKSRSAPTALRELGKHPDTDEAIGVFEGRYGPYVKHGKINATIPKDYDINGITLEQAIEWIEVKAAKKGKKLTKKASTKAKKATKDSVKKDAAKKDTATKDTATKDTAKKKTTKKTAKKAAAKKSSKAASKKKASSGTGAPTLAAAESNDN